MSAVWATEMDYSAAHKDSKVTQADLNVASRVITGVLAGGYFDTSDATVAGALKDATVAQAFAQQAATARRAGAPTADRITSAKIGTASYTLAASTTPESSETRVTGDGVSVDALAILTEAGLLPVVPWLVG